jgi:hypothetical protein
VSDGIFYNNENALLVDREVVRVGSQMSRIPRLNVSCQYLAVSMTSEC